MKGLRLLAVSFLSLFCCLLAAPAGALTITYNVDNDPGKLQTLPTYMPAWMNPGADNHLYPGSPTAQVASGNTLNISADVPGFTFGGLTQNGNSADNTVNISGSATVLEAYGGYAFNGNATGNTVNLSDTATAENVNGGYVFNSGNATGNTVSLSDTATAEGVYGGDTFTGNATGNSVSLSDDATALDVYGGSAFTGNATDNSVSLGDDATALGVYGGYTDTGNATGNTISLSGDAQVSGGVTSGYVQDTGNIEKNKITLRDKATVDYAYGGFISRIGNATGNTVSLGGSSKVQRYVGGASVNAGNVAGNTVSLSGRAQAGGDVYGGKIGHGDATGNTVTMSGGTVGASAYGGQVGWIVISTGMRAGSGNATGNSVSLGGSAKVIGDIYGGDVVNTGNATDNSVSLGSSAQVGGNVLGGFTWDGNATGNTVSLGGSAKVGGNVYGGMSPSGDALSDNTLRVSGKGIEVGGIANFEKYVFTLPAGIANGDIMIKSGNTVDFSSAASTTLALAPKASLNKGDSVTLVDNTRNASPFTTTIANFSSIITGDVDLDGNELKFSVTSAGTNPRTKALAEGRAASMAFVNQGGDMAAGPGLMAAYSAAPGLSAFAAIDGGKSRYKSGSHVDVKGFSMLTGLAWKRPHEANSLMLGGFLEAGWGNYDSHNSFSGFASVEGEGDMSYLGGGLMGRYGLSSGLYFDGSMRVGRAKSDFDSDDLNYGGVKADYDSSTTYCGLHLGAGYEWAISPASMLDFYGKYLWTHQGSDSMTVAGDKLKLDSSNSHRLRAGLRYSYSTGKAWAVTPYAGAAYEHEFDGEAGGTIAGRTLDAPELKGGTGIGEAGINISPGKLDNLSLGLGVRGYIGQREGVTGNLEFRWTF